MHILYGAIRPVLSRIVGDLSEDEFDALMRPKDHSPLMRRRRAALIISRVRMIAALFAILTPLWIVVDLFVFEWPLWGILAGGRVLASLAFGLLAVSFRNSESHSDSYQALGMMLFIPMAFYLFSHPIMDLFEITGLAQILSSGYTFLPFVMVAGLAVFPLTALEAALFSLPMIVVVGVVSIVQAGWGNIGEYIGDLWLLSLIAVVGALAGMSQLHFMSQLVSQASRDGLTKAYNRRYGEELLELQMSIAIRQNFPVALAFIDLDKFKSVNDQFGHEEGDKVLSGAANKMREMLRRGDMLIRWGGEEFLIVLPYTDADGARSAIRRIRDNGFGLRPDGRAQTASIGIAERVRDDADNWTDLIELADRRMYMAKQSGRDRVVLWDDEVLIGKASLKIAS